MNAHNLLSHPLRIDTLVRARFRPDLLPGTVGAHAETGALARDLDYDLEVIRNWGATKVWTLMETHTLHLLRLPVIGERVMQTGFRRPHSPIVDAGMPDRHFEQVWRQADENPQNRLQATLGSRTPPERHMAAAVL